MNQRVSLADLRCRAFEAIEADRYVVGTILLERFLQSDPDDGYGWFMLSDAYRATGHLKQSKQAMLTSLEHSSAQQQWLVFTRLAIIAKEMGDHAVAEDWFSRASEGSSFFKFRWPSVLRANNLIKLERFSEAEAVLRTALEISDESDDLDETWNQLGVALLGQRKYDAARSAFQKAVECDPQQTGSKAALVYLAGIEDAEQILLAVGATHSPQSARRPSTWPE